MRIYQKIKGEDYKRLRTIWNDFQRMTTNEFWEVNDRGINLDYLYPDQRAALRRFFNWFEGLDLEEFTSDKAKARQLAILKRGNFGSSVHTMVKHKSTAQMKK